VTRRRLVVAIALFVGLLHFVTGPGYRGPARSFVNGYLIDLFLPLAMYLVLGLPERPLALSRVARVCVVLSVGCSVEALQYFGVPIFGRTFDPVDLVMYALGVAAGIVLEAGILPRFERGRAPGTGRSLDP